METDNEKLVDDIEHLADDALANTSQELTSTDVQEDLQIDDTNASKIQQGHFESILYREGPIPDPETLREYNDTCPGFAKEFLAAFLEEGKHRRGMELKEAEHRREIELRDIGLDEKSLQLQEKLLAGNQLRSNLGLLTGFGISMTALIGGGWLVYAGHDWAGAAIAGPALASLAAVFVTGVFREQQKAQQDKNSSALSTTKTEDNPENEK